MNHQSRTNFDRFPAFHLHWTGTILLSRLNNEIRHEGTGSRGTYELRDQLLNVHWDEFAAESFILIAGSYVQEAYFNGIADVKNLSFAKVGNKVVKIRSISVETCEQQYEVAIRLETTDALTFRQIFLDREYESPNLPKTAATIVDLGANVGYGTVWFGLRYPAAQILCVEPDSRNFSELRKNTFKLGSRVQANQVAVWISDGEINLHTETNDGKDLGAWGVQVSELSNRTSNTVACRKLINLLNEAQFDCVDILKVDIEGAELELFSSGTIEWLDRVKMVIIETHDRFRSGSEAAVRSALLQDFNELPRNGENLLFIRR